MRAASSQASISVVSKLNVSFQLIFELTLNAHSCFKCIFLFVVIAVNNTTFFIGHRHFYNTTEIHRNFSSKMYILLNRYSCWTHNKKKILKRYETKFMNLADSCDLSVATVDQSKKISIRMPEVNRRLHIEWQLSKNYCVRAVSSYSSYVWRSVRISFELLHKCLRSIDNRSWSFWIENRSCKCVE